MAARRYLSRPARPREACAPTRTVHAKLAVELDRHRTFLRGQLVELFAPELAASGTAVLPAIEVLCSHRSWDRLRHDQGLSAEAAAAALIAALTALLAGQPDA